MFKIVCLCTLLNDNIKMTSDEIDIPNTKCKRVLYTVET